MKLLCSSLRSLSVAVLLAGALSSTASADVIAAWDVINAPSSASNPQPPPWDYHDDVTVSNMTMHGNISGTASGNALVYKGFSSSINFNDYIGFTVTPAEGHQLTLTDLYYVQGANGTTSYAWGYRIGDGEWDLFTGVLVRSGIALKTFTFIEPIVTTQEIEFGFFASSSNPINEVFLTVNSTANDIRLNGTVTAVPEPSTYALIVVGGLVALVISRRRQAVASA